MARQSPVGPNLRVHPETSVSPSQVKLSLPMAPFRHRFGGVVYSLHMVNRADLDRLPKRYLKLAQQIGPDLYFYAEPAR